MRFTPRNAVTKRRILVGLIGRTIQGSLSPALFADAFAAAGIDGFYHLLDADRLPERRLPELLGAIKAAGFAGANITYPFKQEILPLLDAIDPEAAQVGAINTVTIASDGRTAGYNFDRHGWRNSFTETLGAASALARAGSRSCSTTVRTPRSINANATARPAPPAPISTTVLALAASAPNVAAKLLRKPERSKL